MNNINLNPPEFAVVERRGGSTLSHNGAASEKA